MLEAQLVSNPHYHRHMRIYASTDRNRKSFYRGVDIDAAAPLFIQLRMSSFSRKVRDIRKRAGLNQTEFAAALGVGQSTVSRWESLKFEQVPETEALIRISEFANVPLNSLVSDDPTVHRRSDAGLYAKVIGSAATGVWSESARWEAEERFEVQLPGPKSWRDHSMIGFVIADNSMNRIYSKDSIVFTAGGFDKKNFIHAGDRVVVMRRSLQSLYEVTVREYRISNGAVWLWPASDEPQYQTPFGIDGEAMGDGVAEVHVVGVVITAFVLERVAHQLSDEMSRAIFSNPRTHKNA